MPIVETKSSMFCILTPDILVMKCCHGWLKFGWKITQCMTLVPLNLDFEATRDKVAALKQVSCFCFCKLNCWQIWTLAWCNCRSWRRPQLWKDARNPKIHQVLASTLMSQVTNLWRLQSILRSWQPGQDQARKRIATSTGQSQRESKLLTDTEWKKWRPVTDGPVEFWAIAGSNSRLHENHRPIYIPEQFRECTSNK